jgi:hypothetical protein
LKAADDDDRPLRASKPAIRFRPGALIGEITRHGAVLVPAIIVGRTRPAALARSWWDRGMKRAVLVGFGVLTCGSACCRADIACAAVKRRTRVGESLLATAIADTDLRRAAA